MLFANRPQTSPQRLAVDALNFRFAFPQPRDERLPAAIQQLLPGFLAKLFQRCLEKFRCGGAQSIPEKPADGTANGSSDGYA